MKNRQDYQTLYEEFEPYIEAYTYAANFVSDDDNNYFRKAVSADVLINLESILVNMIKDNEYSQGIDCACRSIMEALVILKMDDVGDICLERKKIFRKSGCIIDYNNAIETAKKGIKNPSEEYKDNPNIRGQQDEINEYLHLVYEYFSIDRNEQDGWNVAILGDSNFYLRDQGHYRKSFDFSKKIENQKYSLGIENQGTIYHFFSHMIHPWCETDADKLKSILSRRDQYIEIILDKTFDFIRRNYKKPDKKIFEQFPLKKNLWNDLPEDDIECIISLCKQAGTAMESNIGIPSFMMERIGYLIKDMNIFSNILEARATVAKFKSLMEMISVLYYMLSLDNDANRKTKIDCYVMLSRFSRLDFDLGLSISTLKNKQEIVDLPLVDLERDFGAYYKDNYGIDNFDSFLDAARRREPLYAFEKKPPSLARFVDNQMKSNICKGDETRADELKSIYQSSIDIEHATGFASQCGYYSVYVNSFAGTKQAMLILNSLLSKYLETYNTKSQSSLLYLCRQATLNEIVYNFKSRAKLETGNDLDQDAINPKIEPYQQLMMMATFEDIENLLSYIVNMHILYASDNKK